MFKIKKHV